MRLLKFNFHQKNVALAIAAAIVLFNLWHISSRSFWPGSIRGTIGVGPNTIELARQTFPDIQIRRPYDGQFTFAIAHDPLLITGQAVPFVDVPRYRYRRMFYPLLAWLLSLGQPSALPLVLFLINITAWMAAGAAGWRIARAEGMPPALATIGVLGISGLQFAAMYTLTEPLALALLLWGLHHLKQSRWGVGFLLMSLACLSRETSVIALAAAAGYFIVSQREHRFKIMNFAVLALMPVLAWNLYLPPRLAFFKHRQSLAATEPLVEPSVAFQPFSIQDGPGLVPPFVGFIRETRSFLAQKVTETERIRTGSITIETVLLMSLAILLLWLHPSLWSVLAVSEAAFCSLVRGEVWNYYAGSSRAIINLTVFVLFSLFLVKNVNKVGIGHQATHG